MKVSKRTLACLCALIMATSSLTAFSVTAAESTQQPAASAQTDTAKTKTTNVKVGKVTAINGSSITVALGEFTSGQSDGAKTSSDDSSGSVSKTKGKKKTSSDSTVSGSDTDSNSKSSDSARTGTSEKRAPGKHGRKHGGKGSKGEFTENGTTVQADITSEVALKKKGEAITASDISVGDIVKLKYDENNKLVKVKVSSKHKHSKSSEDKQTTDNSEQTGKDTSSSQA